MKYLQSKIEATWLPQGCRCCISQGQGWCPAGTLGWGGVRRAAIGLDGHAPAPADWSRSEREGVGGGAPSGSAHRWLGSALGLRLRNLGAGVLVSRPLRFVLALSVAPAGPSVPAADAVKKDRWVVAAALEAPRGCCPRGWTGRALGLPLRENPCRRRPRGLSCPAGSSTAPAKQAAAPTPQEKGEPRRLFA